MGKKNKDKKGKGKEKTELKTEKKAAKRAKKEIAEKGEEDIEQLIAKFTEYDRRMTQVIEEKCPPPSPRCNMTLVPHPDKEELIMFGGEYFTGTKMHLYNDLFIYNTSKDEWMKLTSPNPPPPRSSHQAVALAQSGGQMWVFGGEFSSHSQNQFFHYRDLWVLHLREKKWEEIKSPGGPSARSGHRMVAFKKQLFVFGGFHDNARDYKYFNDLYMFDTGAYVWTKLEATGTPPTPRSGCLLFATPTRLLIYGGYSKEKIKRDVDKGFIHSDMFALMPEGKAEGSKPNKWRWQPVKQSGVRPSPRCSMSAVIAPGNRGVLFGGVFDEEEDEEQLDGIFYNDIFSLDLDKGHWYSVNLRGERQPCAEKKRRRKQKHEEDEQSGEVETEEAAEDPDELDKNPEDLDLGAELAEALQEEEMMQNETDGVDTTAAAVSGASDVFTVTVGHQTSSSGGGEVAGSELVKAVQKEVFVPSARMKPCLAVKESTLYLYGGIYEDGDKQVTLSDFYTLDLGKLNTWKTIIASDLQKQEWQDSSSEDEEENRKRKGATAMTVDDESDDDSDDDIDITFDDAPKREEGETSDDYFSRTQDYWLTQAKTITESDGITLSDRKLQKLAREICDEAISLE